MENSEDMEDSDRWFGRLDKKVRKTWKTRTDGLKGLVRRFGRLGRLG